MDQGQLKERFRELFGSVKARVDDTKEAYDSASRFNRYRIWILASLGANVLVTLTAVFLFSGPPGAFHIEAWYEPGFPDSMLILRNEESSALRDVELVLDGRYRLVVPRLPPGLGGFAVNRDFRDENAATPGERYRPQQLEIVSDGNRMAITVGQGPTH